MADAEEKKKPAEKKEGGKEKKGKSYKIYKLYEIKDGKLTRKNKFSPKAGPGYFMAEHKDRRVCGKTYYMEKK